MILLHEEMTTKTYLSKFSAIRGLWRWFRKNVGGQCLVGENGSLLQWTKDGKTYRAYASYDPRDNRWFVAYPIL